MNGTMKIDMRQNGNNGRMNGSMTWNAHQQSSPQGYGGQAVSYGQQHQSTTDYRQPNRYQQQNQGNSPGGMQQQRRPFQPRQPGQYQPQHQRYVTQSTNNCL